MSGSRSTTATARLPPRHPDTDRHPDTPTPTPTPTGPALSDFVVLGLEGVWLRAGSRVLSGHIGANTARSAASLRAGLGDSLEAITEVIVGQNVRLLDPDSDLYGDRVR